MMQNRLLITLVVCGGLAVWAWSFRDAFVSEAAQQCTRLYAAARTAADSTAADSVVPSGTYRTREPRSCGSFRDAARWLAHP